ncbi:MAG: glycosyltransferase family 2 protein [Patescibacteria group bacterium]
MKLSIVIVNYNTAGLLREFLRAIFANPPEIPYEIIVVDNGSRDRSIEVLKEFSGRVQVIDTKRNLGYSRGTNVGIQTAQGEFILLANTDLVWEPAAVLSLVAHVEANPKVGAVGPKLLNPDSSLQYSCYRFHTLLTALYRRTPLGRTQTGKRELARFLMTDWSHDETRAVPWLMSSCLLLRRAAMTAVGNFDERYFVYFADTDYCRRLWLANWEVHYLASASLIHFHRRESADDWRTAIIHSKDLLRYFWKWRRSVPPRV